MISFHLKFIENNTFNIKGNCLSLVEQIHKNQHRKYVAKYQKQYFPIYSLSSSSIINTFFDSEILELLQISIELVNQILNKDSIWWKTCFFRWKAIYDCFCNVKTKVRHNESCNSSSFKNKNFSNTFWWLIKYRCRSLRLENCHLIRWILPKYFHWFGGRWSIFGRSTNKLWALKWRSFVQHFSGLDLFLSVCIYVDHSQFQCQGSISKTPMCEEKKIHCYI